MKKTIFILGVIAIMLSTIVTNAKAKRVIHTDNIQIAKKDTLIQDSVLYHSEVMPQFPEGEAAMMKFIADSLKYPITTQCEVNLQGRVTVRFVVTKTGDIKNIEVIRGISPILDKEAIRVIESMPKWIPGKQNGTEVDIYYILPIVFRH